MSSSAQIEPIEAMRRAFSPDVMLLFIMKEKNAGFEFLTPMAFGTEKDIKAQYEHDYWQIDPLFRSAITSSRPVLGSNANYSYDRWCSLQYYKTFLEPHDLDHELAVYIRESSTVFGGLSVMRAKGRGPFLEGDLTKARLLLPYLSDLVHDFSTLDVSFWQQRLDEGRPRSERGVVILDSNLNVIGYNDSAGYYCRALNSISPDWHSGLSDFIIDVPPVVKRDCQDLKTLCDSGLRFACTPRKRVLAARDGEVIATNCAILANDDDGLRECKIIIDFESCQHMAGNNGVAEVRSSANLTKREWHVVQLVAAGHTNQQIADELSISRYTVENHLKRVFEKTRVKNRTALAKLFLANEHESASGNGLCEGPGM
jgi:DNA-binding CsgD family transcriptional regulator